MKKMIVANWKMYFDPESSLKFFQKFKIRSQKFEIVICPSFAVLSDLKSLIRKLKPRISLGAQNCFWEERGSFTGEMSPRDLKESGCRYVIIGHSERRRFLNETDGMINKKIKAVLKVGLIPILCVGETKREKEAKLTEKRVREQLKKDLSGVSLKPGTKLTIAYEPIWAIGTGKSCAVQEAVKMHYFIKKITGHLLKKGAWTLYGGSVDEKNVAEYLKRPEIDGVLAGRASLKPSFFEATFKNSVF